MPRNLPAVEQLAALDGVVYFAGLDEGHGQELWQSDGPFGGFLGIPPAVVQRW